jgi:hypothetical protein
MGKNGQRPISLTKLRRLDKRVADTERMAVVRRLLAPI